ncbi:MAG: Asp-tRNA(Asn)/Glu-tRNA(Gln) amidotransferase subunit GatB [Limnochordia bacterium]
MTKYEAVIGLEIHVELGTESKIFCSCSTEFGGEPNTQCCPVCLGLPGALPVLNQRAVEYAAKASLALNCEIATTSWFDRKNYFYPDLPKGYQISQYYVPIGANGYLQVGERKIGINRVHMEEEVGKTVHGGENIIKAQYSMVDYNRAGIPLIEIVTGPDLRTPEESHEFLQKLRTILRYIDVSDCKMEEGSLRCDANISLRPVGSEEFGAKIEIKNLNSFRAVRRALEYEIERQTDLLLDGETIETETRHWDEAQGITISMRSKGTATDYRLFPDPNLVPIVLTSQWVEEQRRGLPELPDARKQRFVDELGLPAYDAEVLTASKELADFFETTLQTCPDAKLVSNWVMGEVQRYVDPEAMSELKFGPEDLGRLLNLVEKGSINRNQAKEIVLPEMMETGAAPEQIIKDKGLEQISDTSLVEEFVTTVIAEHPQTVEEYLGGKEKAIGFLVGQVMKMSKGKANPQLVNQLLREKLRQS